MKQLDKLEKQIKAICKNVPSCKKHDVKLDCDIHILEDNYCYSCQGECKYKDNNEYVEAGKYKAIFIEGEFSLEDVKHDYTPWQAYRALSLELERQMKEDEAIR